MSSPTAERVFIGPWPMRIAYEILISGSPLPYDREEMAERLGCSTKTVYNAVTALIDLGAIEHRTTVAKNTGKVRHLVAVADHPLWALVRLGAAEEVA